MVPPDSKRMLYIGTLILDTMVYWLPLRVKVMVAGMP